MAFGVKGIGSKGAVINMIINVCGKRWPWHLLHL